MVNREGTRPNPAKIEPIKNYPVPRNLKVLRPFLGTSFWYRRFIPNYAIIAEPLTNLTKKNQKYEWLEEQKRAFELLCAMVMTAPVLHRRDPNGLFVVQTDASNVGLGAVLLQEVESQERVIHFASRVLTLAERNYSVTDRECLAVVWAIQKFAPISRHMSLKS